jgi:hypothetical protein
LIARRARSSLLFPHFLLLEGVVDGDREGRMGLNRQVVQRACHALQKESLGGLFAAVAVGCGDQLLRFGRGQGGVEVGEDRSERATQPDVEEVRQVGVADVVVVRRIS